MRTDVNELLQELQQLQRELDATSETAFAVVEHPCEHEEGCACPWWHVAVEGSWATVQGEPTQINDMLNRREDLIRELVFAYKINGCGTSHGARPCPNDAH